MGESIGATALHAVVAQLREKIEDLEHENAELRSQLGFNDEARWRAIGLTKYMGRLLAALMAQSILTKDGALHALYWDNPTSRFEVDAKITDVWVCNLRRRLRPMGIAIETVWGIGWKLAPGDKDRLRDALAKV